MGMIGCFTAVPPDVQNRLRSDPSLIEDFLFPEDGEGEPEHTIDVDKAWHGIHFLLNGTAWGGEEPFSLAVLGGEEVGEDFGYGAVRFLFPAQVKLVAQAIASMPVSELKKRYIPKSLAAMEIYPDIIWERDGDEALEYLLENYKELVEFYKAAATRGDGVLAWIS